MLLPIVLLVLALEYECRNHDPTTTTSSNSHVVFGGPFAPPPYACTRARFLSLARAP